MSGPISSSDILPFFVNKVEGLTGSPSANIRALQVTIGDVLGVPLLEDTTLRKGKTAQTPGGPQQLLWDTMVLSNYMLDFSWLLQPSEAGKVIKSDVVGSLLVLSGEKDNSDIASSLSKNGWQDVCHGGIHLPLKEGQACIISPHLPVPFGTHHTKAAICIGKTFIRVAIFTANFIYDDWYRKNQGIYMQDFPLKGSSPSSKAVNLFEHDLTRYFTAAGWRGCEATLRRFDYSTARCHLVASIPGYHPFSYGTAVNAPPGGCNYWGMWHLRHQLTHHLPSAAGDALTWQYSSQGSLTNEFINELTLAMMASTATGTMPSPNVPSVSVVFPTVTEVRRSVEGWRGGLSIPVPSKNLHDFINRRYYRWSPKIGSSGGWSPDQQPKHPQLAMTTFGRHRYMPHIKSYCKYSSATREADWVMLTSANLSRAAWGDVQKKGHQLMIRSYELGVLFIGGQDVEWEVKGIAKATSIDRSAALAAGLHRITLRRGQSVYLPYDVTAPVPYDSTVAVGEGKTFAEAPRDAPWAVDILHQGPDILGFQYEDILNGYSHYGEGSWKAPILTGPVELEGPDSPQSPTHHNATASGDSANPVPTKRLRAESAVAAANASVMASSPVTSSNAAAVVGRGAARSDVEVIDLDSD